MKAFQWHRTSDPSGEAHRKSRVLSSRWSRSAEDPGRGKVDFRRQSAPMKCRPAEAQSIHARETSLMPPFSRGMPFTFALAIAYA